MEVDYYSVLGIERSADAGEIRRAYKRLALSCHPDKVPAEEREEASIKFKAVSEAYETLSDPDTRAHYDAFGANTDPGAWQDNFAYQPEFGPDAFAEFFGFTAGGGSYEYANGHHDQNGGPSSFYESQDRGAYGGKHHAGYGSRATRTEDAVIDIPVSLADVYNGRVIKLDTDRDILCKLCHGTGAKPKVQPKTCDTCGGLGSVRRIVPRGHGVLAYQDVPCETCRGRGRIIRSRDLCKRCRGKGTENERSIMEVYIPRGTKNFNRIVLVGRADQSLGKQTGDIVVTVSVTKDDVFERKGNDLHAHVQITLAESLGGGITRVMLTHLDGRGISLAVPRGTVTKPGSIFKIKGEGMICEDEKDKKGNLYLHTEIEFPDKLDRDAVDALQNLLSLVDPASPDNEPSTKSPNGTRGAVTVDHTVVFAADLPNHIEHKDEARTQKEDGCTVM